MMAPVRAPAVRAKGIPVGSLGGKLLLILAAVALTGAVTLTLLLTAVIMPSFAALERQAIGARVERAREFLAWTGAGAENAARPARGPATTALSYRAADGGTVTLQFAQKREAASGAVLAALRRLPLDRIAVPGRAGHVLIRVDGAPVVVGLARVPTDPLQGASTYRVAVQPLDVERLRRALGPDVRLGAPEAGGAVATMNADSVRIAVPVAGYGGVPVATIEMRARRDLTLLGRHVLWLAVGAMSILLVVVLAVLRRLIAVLVLRPVRRVEAHMQRVRDSRSFTPLAVDGRQRDEIASLGHSFNSMLAQLKDLSERVEAQSFALGRAESAVAVMHNVRNALTPVTTILGTSLDRMRPVDRRITARALAELSDSATPDDRRARLVDFVAAAFAAEDRARAESRDQLRVGRDAMNQVLEIIGAQQAKAHARPALETCDATQVVAQNAAIACHAVDDTSIAINFPARPHPVVASRLLLSQVIGNLLSNAVEAIGATGGSGAITVAIDDLSEGVVAIAIRDDGEGFDADVGAQLFHRGFSTRPHKSGGLGLHWCANSMAAMGGTLRLESEGKGLGATARLTLRAPDRDATGAEMAA